MFSLRILQLNFSSLQKQKTQKLFLPQLLTRAQSQSLVLKQTRVQKKDVTGIRQFQLTLLETLSKII